MDEQITVEGMVYNIKFHNKENGYTVFELDKTVCVGNLFGINEGEALKLTGNFTNHPVYGRQFQVSHYERYVPTSLSGIERYLASGAVKGIGAKLAPKIVAVFKEDTLNVIENYPNRLTEISGITLKKAKAMSESLNAQKESRGVMVFLQENGISQAYGIKIYKKFGAGTVDVLKNNPYLLCDEIKGIGFLTADRYARKMGIRTDSPYRIHSAVKYLLNDAAGNGHVYLPKEELLRKTAELLEIDRVIIENSLQDMQMDKDIRQEKDGELIRVYLSFYYHAEVTVARKIVTLLEYTSPCDVDTGREITDYEQAFNIKLAENQKTAIQAALSNGVFVMTGGPGTGKTTTINAIIHLLNKRGKRVELAAPTGRASKRLSEATGQDAKTIHRLLEVMFINEDKRRFTFARDEDNPLETDVLIIDECSMLDISLMYNLVLAIPAGCKLILVGDCDQLPSVGPGNVLKDIIASKRVRTVALDIIWRQAAKSAIVTNAHKINAGEYPDLKERDRDFFFINISGVEDCVNKIIALASRRLPTYLKTTNIYDIQVLTPHRKSDTGALKLNEYLQAALNPRDLLKNEKEYKGVTFREGDKVMQIKNNYDTNWSISDSNGDTAEEGQGVFNGDFGIITRIDNKTDNLEVLFDDNRRVIYDYASLEELEHAYAVTIHKSQGSEYKAVIIALTGGSPLLLTRNLLYTALTRAKKLAVIVSTAQTLYRMVDNNKEINRYTTLRKRIESMGVGSI